MHEWLFVLAAHGIGGTGRSLELTPSICVFNIGRYEGRYYQYVAVTLTGSGGT